MTSEGTTFDVPVIHQIAHKETYVVEVCKSNSLVPVNASLTAFALQDYDKDLRQLKVNIVIFCRRIRFYFIVLTIELSCMCVNTTDQTNAELIVYLFIYFLGKDICSGQKKFTSFY